VHKVKSSICNISVKKTFSILFPKNYIFRFTSFILLSLPMINLKLLAVFLLFCVGSFAQNWSHVGPLSTNLEPVNGAPNLFETAQINLIEVNPWNDQHVLCGGRWAGLWESTNGGAHWKRIGTTVLGTNGIGCILFLNEKEVFVSNYHNIVAGIKISYSMFSGIYATEKKSWSVLTPITQEQHLIYDAGYAQNELGETMLLVGTTKGLFTSKDKGKNWKRTKDFTVFSVRKFEFDGKDRGFLFGAKHPDTGAPMVAYLSMGDLFQGKFEKMKHSALPVYDSQLITTNNQSVVSAIAGDCVVAFGEVRSAEDFDVFVLADQDIVYTQTTKEKTKKGASNHLMLNKARFNGQAFTDIQIVDNDNRLGQSVLFGARTGLAYDEVNKGVWYSGVKLHFAFDPAVSNKKFRGIRQGFRTGNGILHDDIHELRIYSADNKRYLLAACDGGVGRSEIQPFDMSIQHPNSAVFFENKNKGLHVMLVNGFSGASLDPDFYVVGGFDIINTDFFRADLGRNEHTESTWENAGGLIDLFDNTKAVIDVSLYNQYYRYVQIDSNRTYHVSKNRSFYDPLHPGQAPIRVDSNKLASNHNHVIGFQRRNFIQDPFRPGRIFYVKHKVGLHQLDTASGFFVKKLDLAEMNPENVWAGWSSEWRWWKSVSFSPTNANSMHIIINGSDNPDNSVRTPMVIKYVGKDLDACFGFKHVRFGKGGAQWKLISWSFFRRFNKIMACKLTKKEIEEIEMVDIETSVKNENQVYVLMRTKVDAKVKIAHYDGRRWCNYGQGLPENEYVMAMVMDYTSDDGIYISTDKGIYYRDRTMDSWIDFSGNYPKLNSEQLEINYLEGTLRAGTFGLGIWKTPLYEKKP